MVERTRCNRRPNWFWPGKVYLRHKVPWIHPGYSQRGHDYLCVWVPHERKGPDLIYVSRVFPKPWTSLSPKRRFPSWCLAMPITSQASDWSRILRAKSKFRWCSAFMWWYPCSTESYSNPFAGIRHGYKLLRGETADCNAITLYWHTVRLFHTLSPSGRSFSLSYLHLCPFIIRSSQCIQLDSPAIPDVSYVYR